MTYIEFLRGVLSEAKASKEWIAVYLTYGDSDRFSVGRVQALCEDSFRLLTVDESGFDSGIEISWISDAWQLCRNTEYIQNLVPLIEEEHFRKLDEDLGDSMMSALGRFAESGEIITLVDRNKTSYSIRVVLFGDEFISAKEYTKHGKEDGQMLISMESVLRLEARSPWERKLSWTLPSVTGPTR